MNVLKFIFRLVYGAPGLAASFFKAVYHDPRDIFIFIGLGLVGYGLWEMYRYWSLVVVGGILLYIALFHYRPTAKKGE